MDAYYYYEYYTNKNKNIIKKFSKCHKQAPTHIYPPLIEPKNFSKPNRPCLSNIPDEEPCLLPEKTNNNEDHIEEKIDY